MTIALVSLVISLKWAHPFLQCFKLLFTVQCKSWNFWWVWFIMCEKWQSCSSSKFSFRTMVLKCTDLFGCPGDYAWLNTPLHACSHQVIVSVGTGVSFSEEYLLVFLCVPPHEPCWSLKQIKKGKTHPFYSCLPPLLYFSPLRIWFLILSTSSPHPSCKCGTWQWVTRNEWDTVN